MTPPKKKVVKKKAGWVDPRFVGARPALAGRPLRITRIHFDHPHVKVCDQSAGFQQVLVRLYELEGELSPVGSCDKMFAEARAICEVFLSPTYTTALRRKYNEGEGT